MTPMELAVRGNGAQGVRGAEIRRHGSERGGAAHCSAYAGRSVNPAAAVARAAAAPIEGDLPQTWGATWFWRSTFAVIVWSISYLVRQPGLATAVAAEPFSVFGNFALEGMLLALGWLGLFAAISLAVLTGAAIVVDPTLEP